ncbi:MAG: ATP-NAD kinase family protein [Candidatus Asgardarchaeia archaeon]
MDTRVGFIINPVAGMGGAVGLKGTDGIGTYLKALKLGAKPIAPLKARRFFKRLLDLVDVKTLEFYTYDGKMGASICKEFNANFKVVGRPKNPDLTTADDTKDALIKILNLRPSIIVFVGGDGTAVDVYSIIGDKLPVIGIPSGVKVYSGVFAASPEYAADLLFSFMKGECEVRYEEVLDIDEDAFRRDELRVKIFGRMRIPYEAFLIQGTKTPTPSSDKIDQLAIAEYFLENMEKGTLYLMGPGTTVKTIMDAMGIKGTLLGVDAIFNGEVVGKDLNEAEIRSLIKRYDKVKIVVSPIGRQGFIFGRGNQQFTPEVLEEVGIENVIILATPSKVGEIKFLRVDTPSADFDRKIKGKYLRVIVGRRREKLMKIL